MSCFVDGSPTVWAEAVGLSQFVPTVSAVPFRRGSSMPTVGMMPPNRRYDATQVYLVHLTEAYSPKCLE
jgi:hypothetical protein